MSPLSKRSLLLLLSFLLTSTQAFPEYNPRDIRAFHLESRDPTALPRAATLQKVAGLHRRHLANNPESLYVRNADAYAEAEPEAEAESSPIMSVPCTSGANCVNGHTSARMPGGGMMPSMAVPHRRRSLAAFDGEAYLDALLSARYAEADAEAEAIMSVPCTSGANCVNGMTSARMPGGGMMPSVALPHRRDIDGAFASAYFDMLEAREAEAEESYWY